MVGLIDETFERVGNDESADEGHFGVTGWKKSHVSFGKGKATISYVGKSGVKQKKTVSDAGLVSALRKAYDDCEGDCIFDHEDGKVSAAKVNEYLKQFDISAKDLRGYHANRVMKEHLKEFRKGTLPEDKKEREKKLKEEFKKALEETAKAVGHEPSTLKSQYLVPGIEDDFMDDGVINNKMTKEAAAIAEGVALNVLAAVKRLDLTWVESLRKDFLILMKNLPRVNDYEDAKKLRDGFKVFRDRFNHDFFDVFINRDLRRNEGMSFGLSKSDADYIDKRISTPAWSFYIAMLSFPLMLAGPSVSEESQLYRFKEDLPQWEARMRRGAQGFWKEMKEVIDWFERYRKPIDLRVPTVENAKLEGFQVIMDGYEEDDEHDREALEVIKEGLRTYRKRAGSILPLLLQKQVPIRVKFDRKLDQGGEYDQATKTIIFYASSVLPKGPFWVAHAIAHEMGHHIWHTILSTEAQETWEQTIKGDYGDLDLAELLNNWPANAWASDMVRYLGDTNLTLALQVEAVTHDRSYGEDLTTKEDFQRLYDSGTRTLRIPKTPITGYANKNPQEAFCEAIGMLVAYGSRAVHEKIRMWLEAMLPGAVKLAQRIVARFTP